MARGKKFFKVREKSEFYFESGKIDNFKKGQGKLR